MNERFFADWKPDHGWGWQQNRAIVGHNYKIAWNLTRVANYYLAQNRQAEAAQAIELAEKLGHAMIPIGSDRVRGGCWDAVERRPSPGLVTDFAWGNTKDFWQQEQAILRQPDPARPHREAGVPGRGAVDVRVLEYVLPRPGKTGCVLPGRCQDGSPVIEGAYADKAGYADRGVSHLRAQLSRPHLHACVRGPGRQDRRQLLPLFPPLPGKQPEVNQRLARCDEAGIGGDRARHDRRSAAG